MPSEVKILNDIHGGEGEGEWPQICKKCHRPVKLEDKCLCRPYLCFRCCECDMDCDNCSCSHKKRNR